MNTFRTAHLTPGFGSEIQGLEPNRTLTPEEMSELRSLFDERSLLIFRDVDLDRPFQQYLVELVCGEEDLSDETIAPHAAQQERFYISNRVEGAAAPYGRLMYHSDGMWSGSPFHVLSLFGEEVEPPVPGTLFVSAARAWETMPDTLRAQVEGRHAVHVPGPENFVHRGTARAQDDGGLVQPKRDEHYDVELQIAYEHPRTGQTLLFVSEQMTSHIVGLPANQSESLLQDLFDHLYAESHIWRHEWREGDLVLWDNLTVQHARPDVKVEENTRTLRKVGWPLPTDLDKQKVSSYKRLD